MRVAHVQPSLHYLHWRVQAGVLYDIHILPRLQYCTSNIIFASCLFVFWRSEVSSSFLEIILVWSWYKGIVGKMFSHDCCILQVHEFGQRQRRFSGHIISNLQNSMSQVLRIYRVGRIGRWVHNNSSSHVKEILNEFISRCRGIVGSIIIQPLSRNNIQFLKLIQHLLDRSRCKHT